MLKAAFRKVKITPEEPAPLQGYNPNEHIADPSTDVLDDLFARILVVDDGTTRSVVVGVDCCLVNEVTFQASDPGGNPRLYRHLLQTFPEGTRRGWGAAAGIGETSVSVHATHTHSAPEHFSAVYTVRIEQAIREAAADLRPVRLRGAAGITALSVNRRPNLQHNDDLPIDRSLNVIVFEGEDGAPIGSIVNCAVHPTLLCNPFHRVSSDFVGLAMREWEATEGKAFVAMFIQGFSGDVGPFGHFRNETEDTYPWVQRYGRELYQEAAAVGRRAEPFEALPLRCAERKVVLPTRHGYFKPAIEVTLSGIRMGEMALISSSCETFNGYVDILRADRSCAYMLFSGVANGYTGYLPTVGAFRDGLGGYEMNTTPYTEEACGIFVKAADELIEQLSGA